MEASVYLCLVGFYLGHRRLASKMRACARAQSMRPTRGQQPHHVRSSGVDLAARRGDEGCQGVQHFVGFASEARGLKGRHAMLQDCFRNPSCGVSFGGPRDPQPNVESRLTTLDLGCERLTVERWGPCPLNRRRTQ